MRYLYEIIIAILLSMICFFILMVFDLMPLPIGKPQFPLDLNPRQANKISREIRDVFLLLEEKGFQLSSFMEFKGFFRDQLNREYLSDFMRYHTGELIDIALGKSDPKQ